MSQIDFYLTDEKIQIVSLSLVRLFDMDLTMMMFVLGSGRGSSNDAIWKTTLAVLVAATIVWMDDETTTTIETAMHSGRNHCVTTVVVMNPHNG